MGSRLLLCLFITGLRLAGAQGPVSYLVPSGSCLDLHQDIVRKMANGQLEDAETGKSSAGHFLGERIQENDQSD